MVMLHIVERHTIGDVPDDDARCWELVDGVFSVTPPPRYVHARVAGRAHDVLRSALPPQYAISSETGVSPDEFNYRVPDLVVARPGGHDEDLQAPPPSDVLLAVEVVSPASVTIDRITKPAQYAMWGIEGFWRVETDPALELTAYVLEPGASVYTELGTWCAGETVVLERPFPISFEVDALDR